MPSSKNYERDYKQEYKNQGSTPKRKKARNENNKARKKALKEGRVKKGSKMDVAHTKPGAKGKTFIQHQSKNRSIKRNKSAGRRGR